MCAALDSARAGARVVLVEQNPTLGGEIAWAGSKIGDLSGSAWASQTAAELAPMPNVRVLTCTTAVGVYDHNVVTLLERTRSTHASAPQARFWIARTGRLILATGAIEQPLIFDHNDRPGIMLAGAARQYLRRYGVAPGKRVLIATNNDSAYALATDLTAAGVTVLAVIDSRPHREVPEMQRALVRRQNIDWFPRSIPTETSGFSALKKVTVGRLSTDSTSVSASETYECDALAVSGGWAPALHLYAQARGKLSFDDTSGVFRPATAHPDIKIVGSAAKAVPVGPRISPIGKPRRQWIDLLHDVTVADLELALRENHTDIEHVKRYTTLGMAADQGKTSAAASLDVLSKLRGIAAGDLGHTTLRPPVTPVTLGAIVGRELAERFAPTRLLPMHDWHVAHGAILQDFGGWQRPVAYLKASESREEAALLEALAVRNSAGLFDGSSLGKIEVQGPDALEFLDRFYINNLKTLQPGRARYGLMLRETGTLWDDGTVVALRSDHLLITTTSGNADRVFQWLDEWRQCEWPNLRVAITPVTEQWATISLAGPRSRELLAKLDTDIDLSNEAFPHLGVRVGRIVGFHHTHLPGQLHRRADVRDQRPIGLWLAPLGDAARGGCSRGPGTDRHGCPDAAAAREGVSPHRQRHRRHDGTG